MRFYPRGRPQGPGIHLRRRSKMTPKNLVKGLESYRLAAYDRSPAPNHRSQNRLRPPRRRPQNRARRHAGIPASRIRFCPCCDCCQTWHFSACASPVPATSAHGGRRPSWSSPGRSPSRRLFVIGHDACHGSYTQLRLAQQSRRPHRVPPVAHAVLALGRGPQRGAPRLHQPQGSRPGVGADVGGRMAGRLERSAASSSASTARVSARASTT